LIPHAYDRSFLYVTTFLITAPWMEVSVRFILNIFAQKFVPIQHTQRAASSAAATRMFDRFYMCILKRLNVECGWNYMARQLDFANHNIIVPTTFPRTFFRMHSLVKFNEWVHALGVSVENELKMDWQGCK